MKRYDQTSLGGEVLDISSTKKVFSGECKIDSRLEYALGPRARVDGEIEEDKSMSPYMLSMSCLTDSRYVFSDSCRKKLLLALQFTSCTAFHTV
jgi:hypothetical protein